jgi:hypothetical protein
LIDVFISKEFSATMCIDTAGTHYIRKIHYVGTKMEDAKGAVMTGLQHSEQVYYFLDK